MRVIGWIRPWVRTMRWPLLALAALVVAACGTTRSSVVVQRTGSYEPERAVRAPPPGGSYQVSKGDTLYSIAFRNKVDFRDLARWNGIDAPYTIWPGQNLRLSPPGGERVNPATTNPAVVAAIAKASKPAAGPVHAVTAPPVAPAFETVKGADADDHPAPAQSTASMPASPATVVVAGAPPIAVTPGPIATPAPAIASAPVTAAPAAPIAAGAMRQAGGIAWRWPADGSLIKKFQAGDAIPGIEIAGKSGDPVRSTADGVVVYSGNGLVGYGELVIIKHSDSFLSAYGHNRKRLVKEGEKVKAGQVIAEMGSSGASRDELQFQIRRDGNPVDPLQYLPAR
ncbi:MAG TPA: peptidoglycan DD-metalloendopeptidase family protein [Luteibacter sp.]|nr:peptidoglycan DD-metalloendopeptidase family protein [Luteibacter sp.]